MKLASAVDLRSAGLSIEIVCPATAVHPLAMSAHLFELAFGGQGAVARRSVEQASGAEAAAAAAPRRSVQDRPAIGLAAQRVVAADFARADDPSSRCRSASGSSGQFSPTRR
ncbi:hypothetical protein GCM10010430_62300 [Kitasatospora cystarginea]|uniref:Uncharacterized protein n=1 Tax=Kitasatospora cystarginea TaxID=58350 RepID=A0ABP5RNG4_9ACTN